MSTRRVVRFYLKGTLEWKHVEAVQNELRKAGFKPTYNEKITKMVREDLDQKDYYILDFELDPDSEQAAADISFSQINDKLFYISVATNSGNVLGSKENAEAYLKACEVVYDVTHPLIGFGYIEETTKEDDEAIAKFEQTGNVEDIFIPGRKWERMPGLGPNFYSPETVETFKKLGFTHWMTQAKKLKDGGLLEGDAYP